MTRLFVGTFIEESHRKLLAELKEANRDLDARWQRKLRWVHPEKLHMTWFFIGDVEADKVAEVEQKLSAALRESPPVPLSLSFDELELWPNARKCRQLVLCAKQSSSQVNDVAERITQSLKSFSNSGSKHYDTFKPHITLLRLEAPRDKSAERPDVSHLRGTVEYSTLVLDVRRISLIESDLGRTNRYTSLKDFSIVAE